MNRVELFVNASLCLIYQNRREHAKWPFSLPLSDKHPWSMGTIVHPISPHAVETTFEISDSSSIDHCSHFSIAAYSSAYDYPHIRENFYEQRIRYFRFLCVPLMFSVKKKTREKIKQTVLSSHHAGKEPGEFARCICKVTNLIAKFIAKFREESKTWGTTQERSTIKNGSLMKCAVRKLQ